METDDVVDLLRELVEIDSINSSLVAGAAGERQVVEHVLRWADRAGLRNEKLEGTSGRPSALVRSGKRGNGKTLLLCGHVDTVGVEGMDEPFRARIDGDRMYGRGAYDMKCGVAAALVACREFDRAGHPGEVVVAAVSDEEYRSLGVQEALRQVRADGAIVTEPTELRIAIAHKGFAWAEIEVVGRAAHGSRPHLGIDAIVKSGPVLVALGELERELASRRHPLLGPGTVHASLISGGREEATIPERCVITLERRTLPGESQRDIERELESLLGRCRRGDGDLAANATVTLFRDPLETAMGEQIVRAIRGAAAAVLGRSEEPVGASFWADSAFIAAAGIPTVLFGPAGDGAHATVEWVSIESTLQCTRSLLGAAVGFCG